MNAATSRERTTIHTMTSGEHQGQPNTVREEWRVTGDPGHGFPKYSFVFGSPNEGNKDGTPEQRARAFVGKITERDDWLDGPHIERRTIIESPWTPETP